MEPERLRVLHLMREAAGGMVTHLAALTGALREAGVEVAVAAPPEVLARLRARLGDGGARCAWGVPLPLRDGMRPGADLAAAIRLRRAVRRLRPHVVHAHGHKAAWASALAMTPPSAAARVVTVHNFLPAPSGRIWSAAQRRMVRWSLGRADRLIAVSETLGRFAQDLLDGRRPVTVVPNALDPRWWSQASRRRESRTGSRALVVACVMRLHASKGIELLIDGIARLPASVQLEAWIAGDGPCRPDLEARARATGAWRRVRFLGWAEPARVWMEADAAVLPWLREGASYSALEAMALGLPVVALECPGSREVVPEGAGLVVDPSPEGLASALERLAREPELRRRMGEQARRRATARTAREMAEETLALYREARGAGRGES